MKKIILFFSALSFIAFTSSMSLQAQSSEKKLDQVELMKQYTGTWVAEIGVDSTVVWEVIPFGKGYEQNIYWKAKGETYRTDKGIIGFNTDGYVSMFFLCSPDGALSTDYGKFESDKNILFERFNMKHTHVLSTFDYHFITPDKLKMIWKWRGTKKSWDDAVVSEWIWKKVNK